MPSTSARPMAWRIAGSPACSGGRPTVGLKPSIGRHEVEGRAQHILLRARRDQTRMGHVGVGQGRQHPSLPAHGLAAIHARMQGRAAQHELPFAAAEFQQQVLGAAGRPLRCLDRPGLQAPLIHPGDEVDPDRPTRARRRGTDWPRSCDGLEAHAADQHAPVVHIQPRRAGAGQGVLDVGDLQGDGRDQRRAGRAGFEPHLAVREW